ncbi:hypothetical protein LshimejAT787_1303000 [Lyophyllum shimeji]|uniref:Uncharacterized protein n=1 Tax=Lyophyllum shimeji TaxID=47721 RepID=A0A9P3PXI1_LYOSH|nr:hypothetical protein LshimejAT787_1303000 [Lyophyllum shimeji]
MASDCGSRLLSAGGTRIDGSVVVAVPLEKEVRCEPTYEGYNQAIGSCFPCERLLVTYARCRRHYPEQAENIAGEDLTVADLSNLPCGTMVAKAGSDVMDSKPDVARWFRDISRPPPSEINAREINEPAGEWRSYGTRSRTAWQESPTCM